jgi:hypothetical protein
MLNTPFTPKSSAALWVALLFTARLVLAPAPSPAADSRVGAAATKITPPLGASMAGYYHERGADGVLDDLYAKALVLEHDGEKAALVCLDLISTTRSLVERARAEIEKTTGLKGAHVMISATHAHTGPELADRGKRGEALGSASEIILSYTDRLPALIAESVKRAEQQLAPARLSVAVAREEHLSFNRRYYLRDGSVGWNPGKRNPDVVMPAGGIDPDVGVLYAETAGAPNQPAKPLATYVNFAMHPDTTGGTKFSADYPGALARILAGYKGPEMLTLFANGACGNLNHIDVNWAAPQSGPHEAHRIGTILAAAVFQAYKQLQPVTPGPLRIRSRLVKLPVREFTPEELEQARADVRTATDANRVGFMKLVRGYRVLDSAAREGKPIEVEVQVVALGNEVAWVSLPGEMFVELGLQLKRRSPFRYTFLAELANGSIGYVPDRRSYAEGNYEPESARCAPGSGETIVEAAVGLLEELHP